jgi:hypothetical protein
MFPLVLRLFCEEHGHPCVADVGGKHWCLHDIMKVLPRQMKYVDRPIYQYIYMDYTLNFLARKI